MARAVRSKGKLLETKTSRNVIAKKVYNAKSSCEMVINKTDRRVSEITKIADKIIKKYDKAFYELSKK